MTARALGRLLGAYAALLVVACVAVRALASGWSTHVAVESAWRRGELVRRVIDPATPPPPIEGATLVRETVVREAPIVRAFELAFAVSLAAGRDGVKATLDGKTAWVTPDDLLARQAYDKGIAFPALSLSLGVDVPVLEAILADRLGASVADVRARATVRRVRVVREVLSPGDERDQAKPSAETLTRDQVRDAAIEAARYLARGVGPDGRFRYLVDAPTNRTLGGYDWPRHAGATYFLAQATALAHDPRMAFATLRAASLLRDGALGACGDAKCVGTEDTVDVGSTALAVIAFAEVAKVGLDAGYAAIVADLARFLRAQQRPDGEFMHFYDRAAKRPIDRQVLYYSGEATLALARAHDLTHDPADLDAARRGLAHLVGGAWSFFGDRYYFGEEHWTCQALADLWARAPDPKALDFCDRWHAYGRRMMYGPGETPYDADGAYGVGPVVTPRLTPVASRCEAAVATLDAEARAGWPEANLRALDAQLRRSLALLVRQQLRPGASHLFVDPDAVRGAMPGSAVDWQLRIDYAQHAGSAMIRWLDVTAAADATTNARTNAATP